MSYLKMARASPLVNNGGGLEWYHGDQFDFILGLTISDHNGYPVELTSGSKVVLLVTERDDEVVRKEFTDFPKPDESGEQPVTWPIDEEMTEKLTPGKYRLRLIVHHGVTISTVTDTDITIRR